MTFWDFWWLEQPFRRIRCFFLGHERIAVYHAYPPEPDYCGVCFIDLPDEPKTIPFYLHCIYYRLVEKDWGWFNWLDNWLCTNHSKRLPRWWEY